MPGPVSVGNEIGRCICSSRSLKPSTKHRPRSSTIRCSKQTMTAIAGATLDESHVDAALQKHPTMWQYYAPSNARSAPPAAVLLQVRFNWWHYVANKCSWQCALNLSSSSSGPNLLQMVACCCNVMLLATCLEPSSSPFHPNSWYIGHHVETVSYGELPDCSSWAFSFKASTIHHTSRQSPAP